MPSLGINLWNWVKGIGPDCKGLPTKVKEMGFTAVEIPMTKSTLPIDLAQEIRDIGLTVTLCASLPKGRDLSSFDEQERRAAMTYLKEVLHTGAVLDATLLCGALYTGGGKCHYLSDDDRKREWDLAVTGIRELSQTARECGMQLALEPLNHFRTSVCNTSGQILQMVQDIGEDNVGLHYDTFHACIDELSLQDSLRHAVESGRLYHVHAVANNRGTPGQGIIPWEEIFGILRDGGYDGCITMETFAYGALDSSYYRVFGTPDEQAQIGIAYMKQYF